jgi:hypothetical protein
MTGKPRDIGTRGRVIVAAVTVGAAGVLAGWMAAGDHTATSANNTDATSVSPSGSSSGGFSDDNRGFSDGDRPTATPGAGSQSGGGYSPPVARTGGS